ncbi:hypothetical protein GE09DRAFT_1212764 [Coniochaeta sp. 2T2.1]|nr:hypothetical protein GE09DRAFT_1212764 [Coniochaeta sp. 2T2.1]
MSAASGAQAASVAEGAGVAPVSDAGGGGPRSGGGEGSSSASSTASPTNQQRRPLRTLEDVVRAPSSSLPDVVVLEAVPEGLNRKEQVLDPKEDLWLTTADGRYNSPIIPLHVGQHPDTATFVVHRDILTKYEYFEKALCGGFLESRDQALHFPDDDPGIFHFLIAYIYEGRYDPIQPISSVLIPHPDKGKGKDTSTSSSSDDESATSLGSDISAQSQRRRERRRRRADRQFERLRQKHPGSHRPGCGCPTCQSAGANGGGPPCWACAAPRVPPPPQQLGHPPPGMIMLDRDGNPTHHNHNHHRPPGQRAVRPPPARRGAHNYPPPPMPFPNGAPMPPPPPAGARGQGMVGRRMPEERIFGEDLRTWLLAYELNIDVYILANKFLMGGFKREVARTTIDMLETAGSDAAVSQVLRLCAKLKYGLPDSDPLLKMVLARVGFLQALLWRREPEATEMFLVENPDVAAVMLRETVARREEDWGGRQLPSMERAWSPPGGGGVYEFAGGYRGQAVPHAGYRPRW